MQNVKGRNSKTGTNKGDWRRHEDWEGSHPLNAGRIRRIEEKGTGGGSLRRGVNRSTARPGGRSRVPHNGSYRTLRRKNIVGRESTTQKR